MIAAEMVQLANAMASERWVKRRLAGDFCVKEAIKPLATGLPIRNKVPPVKRLRTRSRKLPGEFSTDSFRGSKATLEPDCRTLVHRNEKKCLPYRLTHHSNTADS
jgi:hypothetical protein